MDVSGDGPDQARTTTTKRLGVGLVRYTNLMMRYVGAPVQRTCPRTCWACAPDIQIFLQGVQTPELRAAAGSGEYKQGQSGTKSSSSLAGSKDPTPAIHPKESRRRPGA